MLSCVARPHRLHTGFVSSLSRLLNGSELHISDILHLDPRNSRRVGRNFIVCRPPLPGPAEEDPQENNKNDNNCRPDLLWDSSCESCGGDHEPWLLKLQRGPLKRYSFFRTSGSATPAAQPVGSKTSTTRLKQNLSDTSTAPTESTLASGALSDPNTPAWRNDASVISCLATLQKAKPLGGVLASSSQEILLCTIWNLLGLSAEDANLSMRIKRLLRQKLKTNPDLPWLCTDNPRGVEEELKKLAQTL